MRVDPVQEAPANHGTAPVDEAAPTHEGERPTTTLLRPTWLLGALAVVQLLIALDVTLPVVRPLLALGTLLALPTLLLHRKVAFPGDSTVVKGMYAFGASLLGVILVGLLLNTVLPLVGVDRPLKPLVLAITWFLIDAALLVWRPEAIAVPRLGVVRDRLLNARFEASQALGVAAVVVAVLGAVRLNNGAAGGVALLAHVLVAATLVALMLQRPGRWSSSERSERTVETRDARVLAMVATSLLLATSLRGWDITGHDVQAEFFAFKITDNQQFWSMGVLQNAYNACLSVNILPTIITQTTGLSGVFVFKVLLQLVFALVPVLTYLLSRRFVTRRLALAAATFTMAFPTFFTDMPYLVRQEIAYFFLALLLLAATEPSRPARKVTLLVGFFGVGVVLSHYSTTYLMIIGLVLGFVVLLVWRLLSLRSGGAEVGNRKSLVLLSPVMVVFLTLVSLMWAGPATNTGGHAGEVAKETIAAIFGQGKNTPGSSDVSYSLFSRDKVSPRERLDLFVGLTMDARQEGRPRDFVVRKPGAAELKPEIIPASKVPLTAVGKAVDSVGLSPSTLSSGARLASAALIQLFLLAGVVAMIAVRRGKRRARANPDSQVSPELVCVVLGALGALGLVVLVPSLSVEYGVLRAFQQTLWLVAPVIATGMWVLLRPFGKRAAALAVVVPVGLLLTLTGVLPALLGGNPARLALANSGTYYDRYLASDADVTAMTWLAAAEDIASPRPDVIANRNDGIRIMASSQKRTEVSDRLYPTMLTRGSYVFVDSHLGTKQQASIFYSGDLITYVYPMRDLARNLNLVYSSDQTKVYR